MKCPVCTVDLVMAERRGIEIDYCPKCRGVWLDRGELDKIIERSTTELQAARTGDTGEVPPDTGYRGGHSHGHDPGKHGYGKHGSGKYRRKSMFQEIFDIFD